MAVNYAAQYEAALQQKYSAALKFNELYATPNNQLIRWLDAKTVNIPRIDVQGLQDVNRDAVGTMTRRVDNTWEPKTLTHDREFRTLVDPLDIDETNMALSIANITRVFNDEQKLPELDKFMASKLYSEKVRVDGAGAIIDSTDAPNTALANFDAMMEAMDEGEVPEEGRILYITPTEIAALKADAEFQRTMDVRSGDTRVNRLIRSLDEVTIKVVPSVRMKSLYNFTSGAVPDGAAVQITSMLVHPSAVLSPMKYEFASLDEPSATTGGKFLYYERLYWDVFLFDRKAAGIQIAADTAAV
jgi:hypothetical protein